MTQNFTLSRDRAALLIVDVQEKLMNQVERPCEVLHAMQQIIKGFQIMAIPIFISEQYPQGLGRTVPVLQACLGDEQKYYSKTTFSCLGDPSIREKLLAYPIQQIVVIGIEAHVCVLQTAKDLLASSRQVVVLNDAITSRSIYDYSTAIGELRDIGVRVSSTETVLFELLQDSLAPEFKAVSKLIR